MRNVRRPSRSRPTWAAHLPEVIVIATNMEEPGRLADLTASTWT